MLYDSRFCAAILSVALFFCIHAPLTGAELTVAKTYPDSPLWPTEDQWDALNDTLDGNLIRASPTALACYPGPGQSRSTCSAAAKTERFDDPIDVRTKWHSGLQCPAVWNSGGGKCGLGNFPVYVVKAVRRADVVEGVRFAERFGLRVVIKNTGHDFLGRNIGYGSLSIWTHYLRGIQFQDTWVPTVGPPPSTPQSAVVIGAGTQWKELYSAAYSKSKIVVGGASFTVGAAGGWPLGGGHGPMSNKYGLGCDNILEAEMVLPSGHLVTTNANSYPDLFWAIRGGGGSTFGIVTKLTYKTHPFLSQNALRIIITPGSSGPTGYVRGMAYLMSQMPAFADFGMTGYPIMFFNKYDCLFTAPGKEWKEITKFITPVGDRLKSMGLDVSSTAVESAINVLMGSTGTTANAPVGFTTGNAIMSSRLISREAALNVTNWERVLTALFKTGAILEPFPVVGGQVAKNKDLDIALNPAWRKAVMHFSILDGKSDSWRTVSEVNRSFSKMMKEQLPLIEELSVDGAAYLNEASYLEPKPQMTFWGVNYPRLVEVKRKYDPNNTLWCHPCVGSDALVLGQDNKLYRP